MAIYALTCLYLPVSRSNLNWHCLYCTLILSFRVGIWTGRTWDVPESARHIACLPPSSVPRGPWMWYLSLYCSTSERFFSLSSSESTRALHPSFSSSLPLPLFLTTSQKPGHINCSFNRQAFKKHDKSLIYRWSFSFFRIGVNQLDPALCRNWALRWTEKTGKIDDMTKESQSRFAASTLRGCERPRLFVDGWRGNVVEVIIQAHSFTAVMRGLRISLIHAGWRQSTGAQTCLRTGRESVSRVLI